MPTTDMTPLKLRGARIATLAIVTSLLAACAAGVGPASDQTAAIGQPQKPIADKREQGVRIALLLPLAGVDQTAAVAKAMKQAAEMALFELDNPAVQLVVKDDGGTAEGARAAAEEAIKDGAEVVLGPLLA
ncbi:MAG TPA: ABC transporter substrate-binding protein, partial [Hyphomicrobiaceae bacterium]|nr:ABC transporter substrate-binding protein [Hyphomicrobiaceae bacterium]